MSESPGDTTLDKADGDARARRGWIRRLYDWVLHWADTPYGTPALAAVSFAESSFFPIPPDPLLMALALGKQRRSVYYGIVCTLSSVLGGLLGYLIGYAAMETIGQWIIDLYGLEEHYRSLSERFEQINFFAVLLAALTPIPYKVFTITAGACSLTLGPFIAASVLGRGLRFMAEALLVYFFGEPIQRFIDRYFNLLCVAFFVLLVGGFVVVKWLLGQ